jgi:LCP family protein required for cell wall assembly
VLRRLALGATAVVVAVAASLTALVGGMRPAPGQAAVELHGLGTTSAAFAAGPDEPVFFLALGSDERAGLGGARSDAVHVIGVHRADGRATIINIPRDTYVPIPGHGQGRINEAYQYGGAELAARTVGNLVGVDLGMVAVTTFTGLEAMVDDLGGLDVEVPMHMDDRNSGAAFVPGRQRLSGAQVLALSRNRHIPGGDLTRTEHQGLVIVSALAQLRAEGAGPTSALRALGTLLRHTRVVGVELTDLYRLGLTGLSIDPAQVRNVTMPGVLGQAGSASVVRPAGSAAALFRDFADDAILQAH